LTANLWLTSWLFQTDFYRNVVTVGGGMQMDAGHGASWTHDDRLTPFSFFLMASKLS